MLRRTLKKVIPMYVLRLALVALLYGLVPSYPVWGQTAHVTDNPPYGIKSGDRPGFYVEVINQMAKLPKTKVTYSYLD